LYEDPVDRSPQRDLKTSSRSTMRPEELPTSQGPYIPPSLWYSFRNSVTCGLADLACYVGLQKAMAMVCVAVIAASVSPSNIYLRLLLDVPGVVVLLGGDPNWFAAPGSSTAAALGCVYGVLTLVSYPYVYYRPSCWCPGIVVPVAAHTEVQG
jgi:hypothetical protein